MRMTAVNREADSDADADLRVSGDCSNDENRHDRQQEKKSFPAHSRTFLGRGQLQTNEKAGSVFL
jgi:hypothetical protein